MGKLIAVDRPAAELKDSGVEFVGEIPKVWAIVKLSDIITRTNAGEVISKEHWGGGNETLYSCSRDTLLSDYPGFAEHKRTTVDDILLTRNGTPYIFTPPDGCIYTNVVQRIQVNDKLNREFVKLCLEAGKEAIMGCGDIISSFNMTIWGDTDVMICPMQEQQAIIDYLGAKVIELDSSISASEQLITQLKLYKRAVITEAVTKGLDPTVPMKDSGVEWIGEIPAHWDIKSVDNLFNVLMGATPKSTEEEYWDGDITWITPADYKTQDKYITKSKRKITAAGYNSCSTRLLPENSVVISSRAPVGTVALSSGELCTNQGCKSLVQKGMPIKSEFVYYYMSVMDKQLNKLGTGTTFLELSTTSLKQFSVPFTNMTEQEVIVNYLDDKVSKIDTQINHITSIITELKAHKKALIFECVTGKKKIIEA